MRTVFASRVLCPRFIDMDLPSVMATIAVLAAKLFLVFVPAREKAGQTAGPDQPRRHGLPSLLCLPACLALVLCTVGLILSGVTSAQADERDFPFTYEYLQATNGERELAYHFTHSPRDNFFQHEFEFEYGFNDRFSLAPYLVFKAGEGRGLRFDSVKLEARYRLGNFEYNRLLPGLYLELEQPEREALETEGKLILSVYDRHTGNYSFNYIFERQLARDAEDKHSWSFGYARSLGKGSLRGGFEIIHRLKTGQLNAGPVFSFNASPGLHLVGGYAFPLNGNDGNRGELRLLAQYHF